METPKIVVGANPSRCSRCGEKVQVEQEPWTACSACLARHHAACWRGACRACNATEQLSPSKRLVRVKAVRDRRPAAERRLARRVRAKHRRWVAGVALVILLVVNTALILLCLVGTR